MFFCRCFNCLQMRGGGPAEIASFSSSDLIGSNKHGKFWHVVLTGYFYVLLLWAIAVLDFRPFEIYENLSFPLSSITFTVNSHTDNHFYKYICLFQILGSMNSVFLWKYMLKLWQRFFIFKFHLNVKHHFYFFYKNYGLQKKILYRKKGFLL